GSTATITGVGNLVIETNGDFTFTPAANYNGPVPTATYTISDGNGGTDTADLSFANVTPVNDAPVAIHDGPVSVVENTPVTGNVLGNDSDPDGDTLTVTQFTVAGIPGTFAAGSTATIPGVGTLVILANGDATFTPATNYTGPVPTATYTVSDGNGGIDTADITFNDVVPSNSPPTAVDDVAVTDENRPVTIPVLANDSDSDGDTLNVTTANATNGTVVINADGTVTYTPTPGFVGTDAISYAVSDGNGGTATATVTVTVRQVIGPLPEEAPDLPPPSNPFVPEDVEADGAVLDALNAINGINPNSGIDVDGIILAATNDIASLHGLDTASNRLSDSRIWELLAYADEHGSTLTGFNVEGLTGFSLRLGLLDNFAGTSDKDQVIIEALVREKVLMVQVSNNVSDDAKTIVEYRFSRADGSPIPAWLDRVGSTLLLGERPADVEQLKLRIEVIYSDGTSESRAVKIEANSGEIQPFSQQQASTAPKMFAEQFNPTTVPAEEGVQELSRMLKKSAQ
ncbi:MAG: cadherin-like domain-containing protein, partial [Pseudomonadota bacterium]